MLWLNKISTYIHIGAFQCIINRRRADLFSYTYILYTVCNQQIIVCATLVCVDIIFDMHINKWFHLVLYFSSLFVVRTTNLYRSVNMNVSESHIKYSEFVVFCWNCTLIFIIFESFVIINTQEENIGAIEVFCFMC